MKKSYIALMLLAFAACDDGPTGPRAVPSGSATATYTGVGVYPGGTFAANGPMLLDSVSIEKPGNWAYGRLGGAAPAPVYVTAMMPAGGALNHYLHVQVPREVRSGAVLPVLAPCPVESTTCGAFQLTLRTVRNGGDGIQCFAETGSVRVTSRTADRIQGTFSGEMRCVLPPTGDEPMQVTNGAFDVPIIDVADYMGRR